MLLACDFVVVVVLLTSSVYFATSSTHYDNHCSVENNCQLLCNFGRPQLSNFVGKNLSDYFICVCWSQRKVPCGKGNYTNFTGDYYPPQHTCCSQGTTPLDGSKQLEKCWCPYDGHEGKWCGYFCGDEPMRLHANLSTHYESFKCECERGKYAGTFCMQDNHIVDHQKINYTADTANCTANSMLVKNGYWAKTLYNRAGERKGTPDYVTILVVIAFVLFTVPGAICFFYKRRYAIRDFFRPPGQSYAGPSATYVQTNDGGNANVNSPPPYEQAGSFSQGYNPANYNAKYTQGQ